MEEFQKIVIRNTLVRILNIVSIFAFVKDKNDILIYAVVTVIFPFLGTLSLWTYLPRYLVKIDGSMLSPLKHIKDVLSIFLPTIAVQIYTVLDKTMIGVITRSEFENGYYEQAIKCARMIMSLVTALGTVVTPRIGYLYEKKNTDEIRRVMYRGYHFVWFLAIPLCFGVMMTAGNFVPWFYGAGYEKVIPLLKILSLLILVIGINNVLSVQYFIPTKRQNLLTKTLMVGAFTNFALNSILIPLYQSIGAAVASVAAETVIAVIQLVIVRKEISPIQVLKEGKTYYLAGILMMLVLWLLSKALSPSVLHTEMMVIIGVGVYFAVLLMERDEFFLSNIRLVICKIQRINVKR